MSANEHYEHAEERQKKSDKDKAEFQFGYPPKNQDKPPQIYSKIRTPNEYYPYRNIKGELEFGIFRDNTKAVKTVRPWAYSHALNAWHSKFPTNFEGNKKYKRTPYKAKVLGETIEIEKSTSVPDDKVAEIIICEGEKTVHAAEEIFKDPVIMSWSGGAKSTHRTDWSIIKDRKVYLWPDNDKEGFEAMLKIGKYLEKDNEVHWVNIPDDFPLKWDLADEVPKSFDKELITLLEEATHWLRAKDTVDPKKFDILQPLGFVWAEEPKRFYVLNEDVWLDKEQLNARYRAYNKNAYNYLLEQHVPMVWTTAYYPKRGMIFEHEGKKLLNAYKPSQITPRERDITPWLKELDRFFGKDGDDQHYYNQYVAQLVQHPDKKVPFCYHKGGVQGNGKTSKDWIVQKIMGPHNCTTIPNEVLFSDFNDYLENSLIIFVEELNIEGKKKASLMNKIKKPISDDNHLINKKMVPLFKHYCPTHWFSNSNFMQPIYLESSDRRFAMYWSKAEKWEEDYAKLMWKFMENEESWEGIRHYYENYDLKGFDTTHPRMNGYKKSLIFHHEKSLFKYLDDHWDESTGPFKDKNEGCCDLINTRDLKVYCKSDLEISMDKEYYISEREIFDWAVSRKGQPLPRKSYRTHKGKRNLIAMLNQQRWCNESEGVIKDYYLAPTPLWEETRPDYKDSSGRTDRKSNY